MSISTEIERLNNAKSAIASAITDKGVDVPPGTKLDGMAELISLIPSGGGSSDGGGSTGGFVRVEPWEAYQHREIIVLLDYENPQNGTRGYHVLYTNRDFDRDSSFYYERGHGWNDFFEAICERYGIDQFKYAEIASQNNLKCRADDTILFSYMDGEIWDLADWLWVDFFARD